jgi:septum site-determining protein MinD
MGDGKGRIITIASGKGGTGKTILASNLGTALTLLGRRVVVVDADIGMADLGLYLGLEKSPITLHEVLAGEATIEQAMYDGPAGCKIVPSGLSLSGFSRANPQKLKEVAEDLSRTFDFIILDCGPGLSKESTIPLAVADEVIIIVNPDLASLADALRIKMMCDAVDAQIRGVVVNRSGLSKAELAPREVGSMLGLNILVDIPDDDEVRKSANLKVPVIMKKKDSPAASAQIKLAKQIAGPDLAEVKVEEADKKEKAKDSKKEKKGEKKKDEKKGGKFRLFGK